VGYRTPDSPTRCGDTIRPECCGDPITQATEIELNDTVAGDSIVQLSAVICFLLGHMLSIDYGIGADPLPVAAPMPS